VKPKFLQFLGQFALFAVLGMSSAMAQYPERQIRFVVPYSAGGGTDIVARLVAQRLSDVLRQPVVVENRAGGDGMLGIEAVVAARPDGYTVLITTAAAAINPSIHRRVRYDPIKDLVPVAQLVSLPFVIVANPKLPVQSLGDLVALARREGKSFNMATGGTTTTLAAEVLRLETGLGFTLIPYKGSAPAVLSVMSGETSAYVCDIPSAAGQIANGALKAMAITGERRLPSMPNVPTAKEAGLTNFAVSSWFAAFLPGGTPPEIAERLNAAMGRIVQEPEVAARISSLGAFPVSSSVNEFTNFFRSEVTRWRDVVQRSGMPVAE